MIIVLLNRQYLTVIYRSKSEQFWNYLLYKITRNGIVPQWIMLFMYMCVVFRARIRIEMRAKWWKHAHITIKRNIRKGHDKKKTSSLAPSVQRHRRRHRPHSCTHLCFHFYLLKQRAYGLHRTIELHVGRIQHIFFHIEFYPFVCFSTTQRKRKTRSAQRKRSEKKR